MKNLAITLLVLAGFSLFSQNTLNYMIETADDCIFIMWERNETGNQYNIFRIDSLNNKTLLNPIPIKPVRNRMQLEMIFGEDIDDLCKMFGVKYPEQILNEIAKNPEMIYIYQAVEPRLTQVYGNGYFDSNIKKGKSYTYEVQLIDRNNLKSNYFVSPKTKAIDRPPLPPEQLNGDIDKYHNVQLYWKDIPGNEHAGFNVYRADSTDREFQKINPRRVFLINNKYMTLGDRYAFTDETVERGKIYYYKVVSVNILGLESDDSNIFTIEIPKEIKSPQAPDIHDQISDDS